MLLHSPFPGCAAQISEQSLLYRQVFNILGDTDNAVDISQSFPMIKMVNWFDEKVLEADIDNSIVDWRVAAGVDQSITQAFLDWLHASAVETGRPYWKTLGHFRNMMLSQYQRR